MRRVKQLLKRIVYGRQFDHVPWAYRVYLRPGERQLRRLQGWWRVRRSPTVSLETYRDRTPVGEIEELIGCVLCGETRQQPLYRPRAPDRAWEYRVVRCPSCGHLYRNPNIRPERLGDLYAHGYSRFLTGSYGEDRRRRYRVVMDAIAPLLDDGAGRRLLDFGCGTGAFLDLAERRGFEAYGVDLSPDAVEHARSQLSTAKVFVGAPIEVDEIAAGGFDVATMWSVLAHLPRPVEELSTLRSLLTDDGVLVILTVNAGSLLLAARGNQWSGFTRNHLMFYSRDTLPELLAKAGFAGVGFASFYGHDLAGGTGELSPEEGELLRQRIDATDGGNMLVAVGFATDAAIERWGDATRDLRLLPASTVAEGGPARG